MTLHWLRPKPVEDPLANAIPDNTLDRIKRLADGVCRDSLELRALVEELRIVLEDDARAEQAETGRGG